MHTGSRTLGRYQLTDCIARGGMGEVWTALDTQLKRIVAIKLLLPDTRSEPDFVSRFEHEARLIASLSHPNIVKIHNFHVVLPPESDPPLFYMVMDYVRGQTLGDYIRNTSRRGLFPAAADIVYIFTVVGLALDYAHQQGMIHRDIKPANILLDQRMSTSWPMGEPILTDFGIARRRGTSGGTVIGSVVGTPLYIAPEQALGNYDDPRSDIYSLGVILYEITTGVTPFQADSPLAIVMQHIHEKPTPPEVINPRVPPALSQVILNCMAKEPEERYASATALALAIAAAFNIAASPSAGNYSAPLLSSSTFNPALMQSSPTSPPTPVVSPIPNRPASLPDVYSSGQYRNSMPITHAPINPITPIDALLHANAFSQGALTERAAASQPDAGVHLSISPEQGVSSQTFLPTLLTDASRHASETRRTRFNKRWRIALGVLVLLVVLGSGLTAFFLFSHSGGTTVVGHIRFLQGNAAVQIDLPHVPLLPQGQAYYAWIETKGELVSPHWQLVASNQAIHVPALTYAGSSNLHPSGALFLITKERIDMPPSVPDTDLSTHLYYAVLNPVSTQDFDLQQCPTDPNNVTCA